MKKNIFYILWAAIWAWLFVKLMLWLDGRYDITDIPVISSVVDYIHGWGFSARKVLFGLVVLGCLVSGIQRYVGYGLRVAIGVAALVLAVLVVIWIASSFFSWMASTL